MCLDFEPKLDYRKRNAMNNMYYSNAAKVITYSCWSMSGPLVAAAIPEVSAFALLLILLLSPAYFLTFSTGSVPLTCFPTVF
jgi:hypothetical protein